MTELLFCQSICWSGRKDSKTYLNEHRISCIRNEIHVESRSLNGMDTTNERKMFFKGSDSNDFIDHPQSSVSSLTCFCFFCFFCFTPKIKRTEVGHGNIQLLKQKLATFFLSNLFDNRGKFAHHLLAKKNGRLINLICTDHCRREIGFSSIS